ncbi:conserved hypothetical protein [Beggiatoa sp. PS]|nr:conserved hypothetical protein [Beggiatoa sp. PS]
MDTRNKYNIVIIGKTGVGKSTLLNYLYGEEIVKVGVGKPVTAKGFHEINVPIKGLSALIFDSWGLEAGRADEWKDELDKELKQRGVDKPAKDWFHSVLYCVAASSGRIEDFELNIINQFIKENYKVTVIFTKSDLTSQKDLDELKKLVPNDVEVIPVCCEGKELIGGHRTEPFGKEEIENQIYNNFWEAIYLRVPNRCRYLVEQKIDKWYEEQCRYIEEETGVLNKKEIYTTLKKRTESFVNKLNESSQNIVLEEIKKTIDMYSLFAEALGYPPQLANYNHNHFNTFLPKIDDTKLTGWDIPFAIVAIVPVTLWLIYLAASGKEKKRKYPLPKRRNR